MSDVHEKLLELAILQHDPQCKWRLLVDRMNTLGPDGCRQRRGELTKRMEEVYGRRDDWGAILEQSCKQAEIVEKHVRRQAVYHADKQDHGEASGVFELASDWKIHFHTDPPADVVERFRAMRRDIYGGGRKCGRCG